jgi:antitoxin ParD1/3/4
MSGFDMGMNSREAMEMNISLTEQLEKFVSEQVQSGAYQSASEVVRDGLRLLADRRKAEELKLTALRAAIRDGLDSGPAEPLDMEAIIAEARAGYQRRA